MRLLPFICASSLFVGAATISPSQHGSYSNFNFLLAQKAAAEPMAKPVETESELHQFWNWHLTLDTVEQKAVNAFIQTFLLNIKLNPSDFDKYVQNHQISRT